MPIVLRFFYLFIELQQLQGTILFYFLSFMHFLFQETLCNYNKVYLDISPVRILNDRVS